MDISLYNFLLFIMFRTAINEQQSACFVTKLLWKEQKLHVQWRVT